MIITGYRAVVKEKMMKPGFYYIYSSNGYTDRPQGPFTKDALENYISVQCHNYPEKLEKYKVFEVVERPLKSALVMKVTV